MAELTFKSPGVSTREIDLSGPSRVGPVGTPAGVIGTSAKGRAFVPMVFATLSEFVAEHGTVDTEKFGPMALREWFSNSRAGLYLKVLGVGDGKARVTGGSNTNSNSDDAIPAGAVRNSGFIVGSQQVDGSTGRVGNNPFATATEGSDNSAAVLNVATDINLSALPAQALDGKTFDVTVATDNNPLASAASAELATGGQGSVVFSALGLPSATADRVNKLIAFDRQPDGAENEGLSKIVSILNLKFFHAYLRLGLPSLLQLRHHTCSRLQCPFG